MDRNTLKEMVKGTIVTTPTPFDENLKLDLSRTREITQWWVDQGLGTNISPLKVTAAGGECAALTDEEWLQVIKTTVDAAGSDAIITCGLKTRSTVHTIEDAKKAQDAGVVALQIDLPFYNHPNQDDYVRFFSDISDAIDIGIMIYNTHWFGAPSITAETLLRLSDAEHVFAVKWSTPTPEEYSQMKEFSHIFNVINNGGDPIDCHKMGGRGYITWSATAYPQHDLDLWKSLDECRYEDAQNLLDNVSLLGKWREKSKKKSGGYRHLKACMTAMGQDVGQPRLPTLPLDEGEISELKQILKTMKWL